LSPGEFAALQSSPPFTDTDTVRTWPVAGTDPVHAGFVSVIVVAVVIVAASGVDPSHCAPPLPVTLTSTLPTPDVHVPAVDSVSVPEYPVVISTGATADTVGSAKYCSVANVLVYVALLSSEYITCTFADAVSGPAGTLHTICVADTKPVGHATSAAPNLTNTVVPGEVCWLTKFVPRIVMLCPPARLTPPGVTPVTVGSLNAIEEKAEENVALLSSEYATVTVADTGSGPGGAGHVTEVADVNPVGHATSRENTGVVEEYLTKTARFVSVDWSTKLVPVRTRDCPPARVIAVGDTPTTVGLE
jgi:hypothetical protein